MKLTRDPKGYHYINDQNIVVSNKPNKGLGDSLGRTARAMLIYDEDQQDLYKGVMSFFNWEFEYMVDDIYVARYPGKNPWTYARGNSRDHVIKAIAALKMTGNHLPVAMFSDFRAKRPAPNLSYTLDQKIWFKALHSKFWTWLYCAVMTLWLPIAAAWNFSLRLITGCLKTYKTPAEFCKKFPDCTAFKHLPKWKQKIQKKVIPTFAFFYTIYAVNALDLIPVRNWLRRLLKMHFEKHNYGASMLLGEKYQMLCGYAPSRKNRWSTRLDAACDRDMTPYPEDIPENNLELGLIWKYLIECE